MARINHLNDFLTDVSSAIQQKTGNHNPIPAYDFDTEILSIQTEGVYQDKNINISQNGNYILNPDQGYDAISRVNIGVDVDLSGQYVEANPAITPGTKTKITYDSKGLVTGGDDLQASDIPDLSATYISTSTKGVANGVATLGNDGKVPSSQLPSYVDDVIEGYYYNNKFYEEDTHTTEIPGETGKIYIDLVTNDSYRYGGSTYTKISNPIDIATQSEAETGTNNTKMMTPLRTNQAIKVNDTANKYETLIGDGSTTSMTVTHNLNCEYPIVQTYLVTTAGTQQVVVDIEKVNANSTKFIFATAPYSNSIKVVILKTNTLS